MTDSSGATAAQPFLLAVAAPTALLITTASLPTGQVGQPYTATFGASGGTSPYTWSVDPAHPFGLAVDPSTGKLSGTPTSYGLERIVATVTDSRQPTETKFSMPFELDVVPSGGSAPLTVLTTALPSAAIGDAYSQALAATGGTPPYSWSIVPGSGSLPPGLSLSGGMISGNPSATSQIAYGFTVQVTDSANATQDASLVLYTLPSGEVDGQDSGTSLTAGGSASAGGAGTASPQTAAIASGGPGTVYVASYTNNLGGPSPFQAGGQYFDVDLSAGSSFTSVTITECGVALGDQMQWFNQAANSGAGAWTPVNPAASFDPDSSCLTFTATNSSTPTVSEITDSVFGAGAPIGPGLVPAQPPQSLTPPTITGSAVQGQTLTASNGSWSSTPNGYVYEWQDCNGQGASCSPIAGANSQIYTLATSDVGHTVSVKEFAFSPAGLIGGPARSPASAVISSSSGGGSTGPGGGTSSGGTGSAGTGSGGTGSGGTGPGGTVGATGSGKTGGTARASGRVLVGAVKATGATIAIPVRCIGTTRTSCRVTLELSVTETIKNDRILAITAARRKQPKVTRKQVTLATRTIQITAGKRATATLHLNRTAKHLLATRRHLKARLLIIQSIATRKLVVSKRTVALTAGARKHRRRHKH